MKNRNKLLLLLPATKLRQGNAFTGICDSIHRGARRVSAMETPPERDPLNRDPQIETSVNRDPLWTEIPLETDPPGQRPSMTDTPLDKHPTGHRPLTETPLDRDATLDRDPPTATHSCYINIFVLYISLIKMYF